MEVTDPQAALRVAEVDTGAGGVHKASFDLRYEPSLEADRRRWNRAPGVLHDAYRVQVSTFNATHAEEAASNMLFLNR